MSGMQKISVSLYYYYLVINIIQLLKECLSILCQHRKYHIMSCEKSRHKVK